MSDQKDKSNAEAIEGAPGDGFDAPRDVLDRDDLDYERKLDILQRWQAELRRSGSSAGETGGDQDERLGDVLHAIEQLQANVKVDPAEPKGAPSGKGYRPRD